MSEYQYYEFQTIDRPLTKKEMLELRSYSTRARITPTTFVNEYQWGDFKGNTDRWMEKYFDAFLYLANSSTRILKLRVPARVLELRTAKQFCARESLRAWEKGGFVILSFESDQDPDDEWLEPEGVLSSLILLRSDLLRGDYRSLYLGWLLCAQTGQLDEEDLEPPVPPGLNELTASLASLAEFMLIDADMLQVAARTSQPVEDATPKRDEIRAWVARLPASEKDEWLTQLVAGEGVSLGSDLLRRFIKGRHPEAGDAAETTTRRRTVGELLRAAEEHAEERRRIAKREAAEAKARQEREAAIARVKYLKEIAGREPKLWNEVASLIASRQPKSYDQAVKLLVDLRDLAAGNNESAAFESRLRSLEELHVRKGNLLKRIKKAGL
jgi:hypothetical protein